jgi:hypothetical protein
VRIGKKVGTHVMINKRRTKEVSKERPSVSKWRDTLREISSSSNE